MPRKYWFEVRHGSSHRCGGEWDVYHVKAYNPEQAKELVKEVWDSDMKGAELRVTLAGDDWMYEKKFDNGVMLTKYDYWER
jgi:hypothetical protein